MDVIKQYEDYIGLKKEYIKNPTLENKNAMIAKLEEYRTEKGILFANLE